MFGHPPVYRARHRHEREADSIGCAARPTIPQKKAPLSRLTKKSGQVLVRTLRWTGPRAAAKNNQIKPGPPPLCQEVWNLSRAGGHARNLPTGRKKPLGRGNRDDAVGLANGSTFAGGSRSIQRGLLHPPLRRIWRRQALGAPLGRTQGGWRHPQHQHARNLRNSRLAAEFRRLGD